MRKSESCGWRGVEENRKLNKPITDSQALTPYNDLPTEFKVKERKRNPKLKCFLSMFYKVSPDFVASFPFSSVIKKASFPFPFPFECFLLHLLSLLL